MKSFIFTGILSVSLFWQVRGQSINWSEHAAPIFYKNCVKCHNPKGVAPFELLTAESAVLNKSGIKYMVNSRQMPPWTPDPHYRRFAAERILSQGEIDTLVAWIDGGAEIGDKSKAPVAPVFSGISEIISYNLKLKAPDYTVQTPVSDQYRCFVIPYSITDDQFITDLEVLPGNRKAVHHVLLFHDNTTVPDSLDALDAAPGYPCFGGTGSDRSALIGGWVPGQQAQHLPQGIGIHLPAKSKAILQVHYPKGTTNATDSTSVLMKFSNSPLRNMMIDPLLNHSISITDGPLFIPAQTVKTFHATFTVPINLTVTQIAPHMHLTGKSMKVWGVTPSGDTIPLINIPAWNFHWQGFYNFRKLVKIPAGTKLYNETVYDNTHNNHHNPDHGMKDVRLGESTSDEMMLVYFSYLYYQPGDETISVTSEPEKPLGMQLARGLVTSLQLYNLAPNPAQESIGASFYLPAATQVKIEVLDLMGRKATTETREATYGEGHQSVQVPIGRLTPGQYSLTLTANGKSVSKWFVKQ